MNALMILEVCGCLLALIHLFYGFRGFLLVFKYMLPYMYGGVAGLGMLLACLILGPISFELANRWCKETAN